ncbi:Mitochondrial import inner membrane translocase subunit Tim8 B [Plecturocebus cupreus]
MAELGEADEAELQRLVAAEQQKAQFTAQVHHFMELCWDKCVEKPGNRLDSRTENCLSSCVDRFIDTTLAITSRFAQITGFHHVGQAGLELLTSGDPPALASQSAEITGSSGKNLTRPGMVAHTCNPSTLGGLGGCGSPEHFGRPRQADDLRSGVQDQCGQHGETLSLLKTQNKRPRRADHLMSGVQDQPDQHGETPSLLEIQN